MSGCTWWHDFRDRVEPEVAAFAARHGYILDEAQPEYRGSTNLITLAQTGDGERIVIKRFIDESRYGNEVACLRHFAGRGLVPELRAVDPGRTAAMTRLPGHDALRAIAEAPADARAAIARDLGRAVGRMANVPLPIDPAFHKAAAGYAMLRRYPTRRESLEHLVATCEALAATELAFDSPVFRDSLRLLRERASEVEPAREVLFHEDMSNTRIHEGRFAGFFDLEMCRHGIEHQLLAAGTCFCGAERLPWRELLAGYGESTGRSMTTRDDQRTILAMCHLYAWSRASDWGKWLPTRPLQAADAAATASWMRAHFEESASICIL